MRRGALLLEVLLALALFLAVISLGFSAIETGQRAVGQGRREAQAVDLALSRLAELEAGILPWPELRDDPDQPLGSADAFDTPFRPDGFLVLFLKHWNAFSLSRNTCVGTFPCVNAELKEGPIMIFWDA